MHTFLVLISAFGAFGVSITHSALKPRDDDGETGEFEGSLHDRLSRIEAIMFADDTLSTRLSDLEKEIKRMWEKNKLLLDAVEKQESTLKQLLIKIKKLQSDNVKLRLFCKEAFLNIMSTEDDEHRKLDRVQKHARTNHTTREDWQVVTSNEEKYDDPSPTSQDTETRNYLRNNVSIPYRHIRQTEFRQVAFYSTISVEDLTNLGVHHTIIFDHVITNIGGAYHPNIGVFITPVDGVYVFNLGAVARKRTWELLELVKDGSWIQSILADAGSFDSFATGSLVAVLELNKGNDVWVRTGGGSGEIHGSGYTFFSGWLLYMK